MGRTDIPELESVQLPAQGFNARANDGNLMCEDGAIIFSKLPRFQASMATFAGCTMPARPIRTARKKPAEGFLPVERNQRCCQDFSAPQGT